MSRNELVWLANLVYYYYYYYYYYYDALQRAPRHQ